MPAQHMTLDKLRAAQMIWQLRIKAALSMLSARMTHFVSAA